MSQIAEKKFPRAMLLGGLSVNLNHLKTLPSLVFHGWAVKIFNYVKKYAKATDAVFKNLDEPMSFTVIEVDFQYIFIIFIFFKKC